MKSIIRLPIMNLVQMLLPVCFILTGQRLSLRDLTISGSEQGSIATELKTEEADRFFDNSDETCEPAQTAANADAPQPEETQHNSYGQEQLMLRMIRQGDYGLAQGMDRQGPGDPSREHGAKSAAPTEKYICHNRDDCLKGGNRRRRPCRGGLSAERRVYPESGASSRPGPDP